jgi:hypothetical protein
MVISFIVRVARPRRKKRSIFSSNGGRTMNENQKLLMVAIVVGLFFGLVLGLLFGWSICSAADGSLQKDPIFQNAKNSSRDNIIVRDADGRRIGYWIKDPIFQNSKDPSRDNVIIWRFKSDPGPTKKADPIFPVWDLDPVGE